MAKKPNASKNKKDINASETSSESNNSLNKIIIFSVFFILGVLTFLGMIHSGGLIGNFLYTTLALGLFGYVGLLVPFILIYIALSVLFPHKLLPKLLDGTMVMILLLSVTGLLEVVSPMTLLGGKIGSFIGQSLIVLVSRFGAALLLFVISVIGILVLLRSSFSLLDWLNNVFDKPHDPYADLEDEDTEELPIEPIIATTPPADVFETSLKQAEDIAPKKDIPKEKSDELLIEPISFSGTYVLPPLSLLSKSAGKPSVGDIRARGNVIKQTLANFGIDVEMDEVSVGPTVTRYAMKPAQGVKLSRIVALKQDLALTLAAHPLRIEAPIPGKSLVGIEIPNISKSSVGLATLLEDDEYQASSKRLLVALGKGVTGKAYFSDLAKMPHLLIAGTTGSGKSVTVHNLIMSLLYRNTPDELRFIMVDPKRVELTLYNDIPHLLTPVIKEPKKAILALKWAAKEMERRYDLLEQNRCRDIKSYHENIMYPAHAGKKNVEESQLPEKNAIHRNHYRRVSRHHAGISARIGICNRQTRTDVTSNRNSLSSFNTASIRKRHHWTHQGKYSVTISTSGSIPN
jgi:S-DNA-T family DNA segregation ATPase FtsK/SpoIIIE